MSKGYPPEFRCKVLDLVSSGRRVAQVAADLDISDQAIDTWRRQELIDTGQLAGTSSTDNTELPAARRRIAELEAEVAIRRRTAELLKESSAPKDASEAITVIASEGGSVHLAYRVLGVSHLWLLRLARPRSLHTNNPPSLAHRSDPRDPHRVVPGLRRPTDTRRTHSWLRDHRRAQHDRAPDSPQRNQEPAQPCAGHGRTRHPSPRTWSTATSSVAPNNPASAGNTRRDRHGRPRSGEQPRVCGDDGSVPNRAVGRGTTPRLRGDNMLQIASSATHPRQPRAPAGTIS